MDADTAKVFEAALRDLGISRLRLDQVVMAYQKAFPSDSMRPDMRERLHEAIVGLRDSGVINIPEGDSNDSQATVLPTIVEISSSAHFMRTPPKQMN